MAASYPTGVRIEPGNFGLERVVVDRPEAHGEIYAHGATATAWIPAGHAPVLWLSGRATFARGVAIRGGVPICFPWFGKNASDPAAPQHGFARTAEWQLDNIGETHEGVAVAFTLASDARTRAAWPHAFVARYSVCFGSKLALALSVENRDERPLSFEAALHAYFAVRDVRDVRIVGLENTEYVDKVDGGARKRQGAEPVRIEGETDRIHRDIVGGCDLVDSAGGRRISIQTEGTRDVVVWNPWIEKARALKDFGDDEWPRMVCIEPANVGTHAVVLAPGAAHSMRARVVVNTSIP